MNHSFSRISYLASAAILTGSLVSSACQSSATNVVGPSGGKCAISLPSSLPAIDPDGGSGTLTIDVAAECVWSASSAADWIAITSNTTGQGSGAISYTASANPTASMRRGAVVVAERRLELVQPGAPCRNTLTPEAATLADEGGEQVVSVNTIEGCRWSAASDVEWISVVGAQTGVGAGTVRFRVDDNSGPARTGTLTIADRKFMVHQEAAESGSAQPGLPGTAPAPGPGPGSGPVCSFGISSTSQSVTALGGVASVSVTAGDGCTWTASSQASWITLVSGTTGAGNGTVAMNVAINTGGQRTGTITVAGQVHTIIQAAPLALCSYTLNSSTASVGTAGGTVDVGVTTGAGCNWTAASQVSWITMTTAAGTGSGVSRFTVAPNSGGQRSGTVTIAGQTFTVSQAGSPVCTYSLDPTTQSVAALGGSFSVLITTQSGCVWTAASQNGWIQLTSSSTGTGTGRLNYQVAMGLISSRSGTITISGQTLRINQAALLLSDAR